MPNLGGPEIVIVLVIVVLLFGAKKLPELGSSVGKSITNFKSGLKEAQDDDEDAAAVSEKHDKDVSKASSDGS